MSALKLVRFTAWGAIAVITAALLYVLLSPRDAEQGTEWPPWAALSASRRMMGAPFRMTT